jgi:transcription antitermination protein NusB
MASRHRSRELAVQMSYQWDMNPKGLSDPKALDRFWSEQAQASDDTREFFEQLVKGMADHLPAVDREIEAVLQNWKMSRIEKVDLAVLRISTYELLFFGKTPSAVVINEAVELAKRFGNKDSPSFINGILDALSKKVKTA